MNKPASEKTKEERQAELQAKLSEASGNGQVAGLDFNIDDLAGAEIKIGNVVVAKIPESPAQWKKITTKSGREYVMLHDDFNFRAIGNCQGLPVVFGLKLGINQGNK